MTNQNPCRTVRLIKPNVEIAFEEEFENGVEAEARYARLVVACAKDLWFGARVQCLDKGGRIVHERFIKMSQLAAMAFPPSYRKQPRGH